MNEVEAVARAMAAYKDTLPPDSADAAFIYSHRHGLARAAIQALDEARGEGWRTIESAPRDGSYLLGFQGGQISLIWWNSDQYARKPRPYWTGTHEWAGGTTRARVDQPTHWRPLPAAPGAGT